MEERILENLARTGYETYAGVVGASPEDYRARDILPFEKLPANTKKHWREVANAIVLASWNIDCGDLE
jgi:hypothetical protein